jgi:hypothetical protein
MHTSINQLGIGRRLEVKLERLGSLGHGSEGWKGKGERGKAKGERGKAKGERGDGWRRGEILGEGSKGDGVEGYVD